MAVAIDEIVGQAQRTSFIIELVEREIRRRQQLVALREAAGKTTIIPNWPVGLTHGFAKFAKVPWSGWEKIDSNR